MKLTRRCLNAEELGACRLDVEVEMEVTKAGNLKGTTPMGKDLSYRSPRGYGKDPAILYLHGRDASSVRQAWPERLGIDDSGNLVLARTGIPTEGQGHYHARVPGTAGWGRFVVELDEELGDYLQSLRDEQDVKKRNEREKMRRKGARDAYVEQELKVYNGATKGLSALQRAVVQAESEQARDRAMDTLEHQLITANTAWRDYEVGRVEALRMWPVDLSVPCAEEGEAWLREYQQRLQVEDQ